MRLNWHTRVCGERVVLQPFVSPFVDKYHAWMEDEWLRDMTASERLSEEEEYQMQADWVNDDQKATFIVFDKQAMTDGGGGGPPAGALDGSTAGMVGDVNLFLLPADEGEEYAQAAAEAAAGSAAASPSDASPAAPPVVRAAEIMIMVAEPSARRRGVAAEAARLMMEWGRRHLGITAFVAKISEANAPSIELFTKKLGFAEVKRVAAFEEVHLARLAPEPLSDASTSDGAGGCGPPYAEESVTHDYQPALPSSKR